MIPGLEPSKPLSLCESSPGNPVKDIYEGVVAFKPLLLEDVCDTPPHGEISCC